MSNKIDQKEYFNSIRRLRHSFSTSSLKKVSQNFFPVHGAERVHHCHYCNQYCQKRPETVWYWHDCQLCLCQNGREDNCFRLYHTIHCPTADPRISSRTRLIMYFFIYINYSLIII